MFALDVQLICLSGVVTPSLQLVKAYRPPETPAGCGVAAVRVCWLPTLQVKVCGVVYTKPSTETDKPLGDEAIEKVEVGLEIAIERACTAVCEGTLLSVTCTVKLAPLPVGVPLLTPVAGFQLRPAGTLPEMTDQMYGGVPPTAIRLAE